MARVREILLPWDSQPQEVTNPGYLNSTVINPAVFQFGTNILGDPGPFAPKVVTKNGIAYRFDGTNEFEHWKFDVAASWSLLLRVCVTAWPTSQAITAYMGSGLDGNPSVTGGVIFDPSGKFGVIVRGTGSAPRTALSSRVVAVGETVTLLLSVETANRKVWIDGGSVATQGYSLPTGGPAALAMALGGNSAYAFTPGFSPVDISLVTLLPFAIRNDAHAREVSGNYLEYSFAPQTRYIPVSAGAVGGTSVTPGVGSLAISGHAPTISYTSGSSLEVIPGVGSISLSGYAPTLARTSNVSLVPGVGSITISGYAPDILSTSGVTIIPAAGSITITGNAPVILRTSNQGVTPAAGSITFSGYSPVILRTDNRAFSPGVGSVTLSGYAPTIARTVVVGTNIIPGVGSITISGFAPIIFRQFSSVVSPSFGSITFTGYAPGIFQLSGAGGSVNVVFVPSEQYEVFVPSEVYTIFVPAE
jgi:hypothetical protein